VPSVLRERLEDGIEVLRLNRPRVRNALDTPMLRLLVATLDELAGDPTLRVIVFSTTNFRALCSGIDIKEPLDHAGGVARMEAFMSFFAALDRCRVPTVGVCVGSCVGGGAEIVTGVDLRVGAKNLAVSWAGGRLGVPVGAARLVPLVGLSRAKELIFSGRTVGVDEARDIGLLSLIAETDDAEAAGIRMAREVAIHPSEGIRRMKLMFRQLEETGPRVAAENEILLDWQIHGVGLPSGEPPPDAPAADGAGPLSDPLAPVAP
jgi:enoyl-CoA hydratase